MKNNLPNDLTQKETNARFQHQAITKANDLNQANTQTSSLSHAVSASFKEEVQSGMDKSAQTTKFKLKQEPKVQESLLNSHQQQNQQKKSLQNKLQRGSSEEKFEQSLSQAKEANKQIKEQNNMNRCKPSNQQSQQIQNKKERKDLENSTNMFGKRSAAINQEEIKRQYHQFTSCQEIQQKQLTQFQQCCLKYFLNTFQMQDYSMINQDYSMISISAAKHESKINFSMFDSLHISFNQTSRVYLSRQNQFREFNLQERQTSNQFTIEDLLMRFDEIDSQQQSNFSSFINQSQMQQLTSDCYLQYQCLQIKEFSNTQTVNPTLNQQNIDNINVGNINQQMKTSVNQEQSLVSSIQQSRLISFQQIEIQNNSKIIDKQSKYELNQTKTQMITKQQLYHSRIHQNSVIDQLQVNEILEQNNLLSPNTTFTIQQLQRQIVAQLEHNNFKQEDHQNNTDTNFKQEDLRSKID